MRQRTLSIIQSQRQIYHFHRFIAKAFSCFQLISSAINEQNFWSDSSTTTLQEISENAFKTVVSQPFVYTEFFKTGGDQITTINVFCRDSVAAILPPRRVNQYLLCAYRRGNQDEATASRKPHKKRSRNVPESLISINQTGARVKLPH